MKKSFRLRTSNTNRPVLENLLQEFEAEYSCAVELIVDSTKNALERIVQGERGDLAVLHEASIASLITAGILDGETSRPFAQSLIGLAVKAGAPHPRIATVDGFRRTLLAANSIAHTQFGPSGSYFPELLRKLDIASEVLPKAVPKPGGYVGYAVTDGEAEMAFQQICELLVVPGIEIAGPIPAELQRIVMTRCAIFAETEQRELAASFVSWCARPATDVAFRKAGLEKLLIP
ncbi:MAG: substrate-binding domain-containing protein [Hyphomicrobiales bacterium]|nr:substrate-binding domain-containing protein [Hyphomicrobiales bacterium]